MTKLEFEKLILKHRPTMLNFAHDRLRSWANAEDAVANAMIHLSKTYPELAESHGSGATILTHLLTIVLFEIGHVIRYTDLRERYLAEAMRDTREEYVDPAELANLRVDVQRAMATLPPEIQYAAWRVHVQGFSWEFVAQELNIEGENPKDNLRMNVRNALLTLRPLLKDYAPKYVFHKEKE